VSRPDWSPPDWSGQTWVGVLALVGLFLLLAGWFPAADEPMVLADLPDSRAWELLVEPPAKAHEARNWALFGEFHRNAADNYQFWRPQAPAWVYPLALTFRVFGTSWATLRLFSVGVTALGLIAVLGLLRERSGPVALGVLAVLATSSHAIHLARSGLIEVALGAAAAWMVLGLTRGSRHPGWLVVAQVAFSLGFFAKLGMVYLFPLLLVGSVVSFVGWVREGRFVWLRWLPVLTAVICAVVAAVLILQPEYLRVVTWSSEHLLGTRGQSSWWDRLDPDRLGHTLWALVPFVGIGVVLGLVGLGVQAVRDRRLAWSDVLLIGWLLSGWAVVALVRVWTFRHASIVIWPTFLVAGLLLDRLRPRSLRIALVAAMALAVPYQLGWYASQLWDLDHSRWRAEQTIQDYVGAGPAVFVGRRAMPVLLGTPYDIYYIKGRFNSEPEAVRALGITHTLNERLDHTRVVLGDAGLELGDKGPLVTVREHDFRPWTVVPTPPDAGEAEEQEAGASPE